MMKNNGFIRALPALLVAVLCMAGCTSSGTLQATGTPTNTPVSGAPGPTELTLLNSKGEIQSQYEEAARKFSLENPAYHLTVIPCPAGSSPTEKVSSMYAAGNAPTLVMVDPGDLPRFRDKFDDLSKEAWVGQLLPGVAETATVSGKLYAFPSTVEGFGLICNRAVLNRAGVDPESIRTRSALEAAFQKVQASGVSPVVISPMDWSLGAHLLSLAYIGQSLQGADVTAFMDSLRQGKADLRSNAVFGGLLKTFDLMIRYNTDRKDPLAGAYERGPELLGKGQTGFWFMGNWAWSQLSTFDTTGGQYSFVPLPLSDNASDFTNNRVVKGPSKQIGIDRSQNSQEAVKGAKAFLNWLVFEKSGQDFLVNKASFIPVFRNITLQVPDPLGRSIGTYMLRDATMNSIDTYYNMPGDHWKEAGAAMQRYLAGKSDATALARDIEAYWKKQK